MNQKVGSAAQVCFVGTRIDRDCTACKAGQMSLCAQVDATGVDRLRTMSHTAFFVRGSILFEQDSDVDTVYILTEGLVKLYRALPDGQRQITGFLGPGDILGALKRRAGAHCTAEALTDVIACAFERVKFLALLKDYPELTFGLLITATDEIEAQQDHMILLGRKRVRERLAAFLLLMSRRWQPDGRASNAVRLPMTRTDIADYLGLTLETVSRTFAQFKSLGLIEMQKANAVTLSNVPELYDLAGFDELPAHRVSIGL